MGLSKGFFQLFLAICIYSTMHFAKDRIPLDMMPNSMWYILLLEGIALPQRGLFCLGLDKQTIKHVESRSLTIIPAADRLIARWNAVQKYFPVDVPKIARKSKALKMLRSKQQEGPTMDIDKCYHVSTKYLTNHLPIDNELLRDLAALHPLMHKEDQTSQTIRMTAKKLPQIIRRDDVDRLTDEWDMYHARRSKRTGTSLTINIMDPSSTKELTTTGKIIWDDKLKWPTTLLCSRKSCDGYNVPCPRQYWSRKESVWEHLRTNKWANSAVWWVHQCHQINKRCHHSDRIRTRAQNVNHILLHAL